MSDHFLDIRDGYAVLLCEADENAECHFGCAEKCETWTDGFWCSHPKTLQLGYCYIRTWGKYSFDPIPVVMRKSRSGERRWHAQSVWGAWEEGFEAGAESADFGDRVDNPYLIES